MNKKNRLKRQQELLSHFEGDFYQEKQVGNEWYVKQWNGGTKRWQIAVYSKEAFKRYKSFQGQRKPDFYKPPDNTSLDNYKEELNKKLKSLGL